jgi:hypothetical protein
VRPASTKCGSGKESSECPVLSKGSGSSCELRGHAGVHASHYAVISIRDHAHGLPNGVLRKRAIMQTMSGVQGRERARGSAMQAIPFSFHRRRLQRCPKNRIIMCELSEGRAGAAQVVEYQYRFVGNAHGVSDGVLRKCAIMTVSGVQGRGEREGQRCKQFRFLFIDIVSKGVLRTGSSCGTRVRYWRARKRTVIDNVDGI